MPDRTFDRIAVIDTHTGGEPTRVVIDGGPDLGSGPIAHRRSLLRDRFDHFRSAVVNEPRGSDAMVGALLCPPVDPSCMTGVIYFNNVGYLGMCGHGTIGVAVALAHLGRIQPGSHRFETPVGTVAVTLEDAHHAAIENVASRRLAKDVAIEVPGLGRYVGDIAWGGNWFFLVHEHGETLDLSRIGRLTEVATRIQKALLDAGIRGDDGGEVDHVELFGPPTNPEADSRSFVLCPGGAYDRSPCGTGTSAKLACLHADGRLREGEIWRQESIVGSLFEGSIRVVNGQVIPRIRGSAYVNAEATLLLDPADPFAAGIRR
jgi:4-hydroxyproline epimerase